MSMSKEVTLEITNGQGMILPAMFSSFEVLTEEEAYPLLSLVADVGGVLGLFVGFNFLMVWDWIVMGLQKICTKIKKN